MRFTNDQPIFTPHGDKVGHVNRVIIDPRTTEVTHIVVRKGFLFSEDKVLPIKLVESTTPERVIVKISEDDIERLPDFEETHYVSIRQQPADTEDEAVNSPEHVRSVYWYPPAGTDYTTFSGYPLHHPFVIEQLDRNIPDNTVPLHEGSNVYSHDGDHVGNVEQVIIDTETNQASHLLVSDGLLFKEKKMIPMTWVDNIQESEVQLATDSRLLEALPDHSS
jgi:uncharacterized protein YrrD